MEAATRTRGTGVASKRIGIARYSMKGFLVMIAVLLAPTALRSVVQLREKWDDSPEYVSVQPYPLGTLDKVTGKRADHVGPYKAGDILTYAVQRTSTRTVTGITTRRIVQRIAVEGGMARIPIYSYPSQPGTRIDANPSDKEIVSYIPIQLPDAKILPPGDNFTIETSVEFPSRGERDARTYVGESIPFKVVE